MATQINLVQGDNRPYVKLTFTLPDGTPVDLSDAATNVFIHFKSAEADEVLTTLTATKISGGSTGIVTFNFPGTSLEVKPGLYEGEVEIQFGTNDVQTIYEPLQFYVRKKLA